MMRLKPVEEQVVVVMGASSGIGRETALRFAERGARVVVSARGKEGLDSLAEEIRREDGDAKPVVADTSEYEQVKAVADRAVEEYGRLDTWVHLAAVGLFATFEQTTPEEFERVIDVNLMGQVYGAMAALPHLKREGRGALIHISSVEAKRSFPFHSAYGASKQGIDGFLEALRVELRHEGWPISVTQVMPGTINTPFFDKGRTKLGVKPVGVPPVYEPETVANIILYAAEDPVRDLVSGGAAQALILNQRLSPRVLDAILVTRAGFSPQETEEPRSEDDVQPMCNVSGSERMLLTPWGVENRVSGTFLPLDRADAIAVAAKKEATRSSTPSSRRRNGSGNTNPKRRFT